MKIIKVFILLLFNFVFLFSITKILAQEGGNIQEFRYKWLMGPRMIPWDSIPSNAYYNMIQQKMDLRTAGFYLEDNWSCLGPKPINDWGTSAGRVSTVAYDQRYTDGRVIFLGSCGGGVWKSTDFGNTWEAKTDNLEALACGSIAIDPNLNDTYSIIYCGTGEGVWFGGAPYSGCGMLKSTDGGENWKLIKAGLPDRTIFYKIAICPTNPDVLFAALQTGLYKSINKGENWQKIFPDSDQNLQCTDVTFSPDGNKLYIIGPPENYFYPGIGGYYISTDMGNSFTNIQFLTSNRVNRRSKVIVCENNPEDYVYIYFGNNNPDNQMILYKSTNGGTNFDDGTILNLGSAAWANSYTVMFNVNPNDHTILYYGALCLHKSTNWGVSFCDIGTYNYNNCEISYGNCNGSTVGGAHPDIHCMDFNKFNTENIIIGCDGGVYTSSNAGLSFNLNTNYSLTLTQFYKMTSFPFNENQLVGGAQDIGMIYKSSNLSWNVARVGDGNSAVSSLTRPNNMLASMCGSSKVPLYSINGGQNFTVISDMPGLTDDNVQYLPYVSHPYEPGVYYVLRNLDNRPIICKTIDDGVNWSIYNTVANPIQQWGQKIAICKSNTEKFYITTGHGYPEHHVENHIMIYDHSKPITEKWNDLFENHSGIIPDRFFSALAIDPIYDNQVFVGLSGFLCDHLWYSSNSGINWISISGQLPDQKLPDGPINDILIYYSNANTRNIVVATDAGVFASSNEGVTWKEFGFGLPNALETSLFYNRFQCKMRVSTMGRGIWEIPIQGPIFINDHLIISSDDNGTKINDDIIIGEGGKLTWNQDIRYSSPKIQFTEGKKIIVQNGGQIDFSNANNLEITTLSGLTWGGIEIQGNAVVNLDNVTFKNAPTTINISNAGHEPSQPINIANCNIYDGAIIIDSRSKVNLSGNNWFKESQSQLPSPLIACINSNEISIDNNYMEFNDFNSTAGIQINYGDQVTITNNHLKNIAFGINVSNASPLIMGNNLLINSSPAIETIGIGMLYSYNSTVKDNIITNYYTGIKLGWCSPVMNNNFIERNELNYANDGLYSIWSTPVLAPASSGDGMLIEDGGYNTINVCRYGIYIDQGLPVIQYGNNILYGSQYYIYGVSSDIPGYDAHYNCWLNDPPEPGKFLLNGGETPVNFEPWNNCNLQGTCGGEASENSDPPQPLIVNRGNGIMDTIIVSYTNQQFSQDKMLYSQAVKQELIGNNSNAKDLYMQVVQNYPHTASAINALKKIIYNQDKLNNDSTSYNILRSYYLTQASINESDSIFYKKAKELASKCLVRNKKYPEAILEYENVIANTSDSIEILLTELNIIGTYLLIQQGGNTVSFTGNISSLKPGNLSDGLKMIRDKFYRSEQIIQQNTIPKEYALYQNYPNPFNPTTTIKYSIPKDGKVRIEIYDITGRSVTKLTDEYKQAGSYEIKFNGSALASGIYFYKMISGNYIESRKMILVK